MDKIQCKVCGQQTNGSQRPSAICECKKEQRYVVGYFPPPWNPNEHPEKTEGWIAFQEEQRKDPGYYGSGTLKA